MAKALKLSPKHSRFLSELAHLYGTEEKWKQSQEIYEQAEKAAIYAPENVREMELLRAKRGIGYSLIERGNAGHGGKKI